MLQSLIIPLLRYTFFLIITTLLISCHTKNQPGPAVHIPEGKVYVKGKWEKFRLGDVDGDGKRDFAQVYTPAYYSDRDAQNGVVTPDSSAEGKWFNKIRFSNKLPEIYQENSLWGRVEPIDDLDEDGYKEVIFQTSWWIGTHVTIYIYSYNKNTNKWEILAKNWLYENDSYKDRVTKIDKTEFKFSIEYMDTIEHDIMTKDTLIKIRK